MRITLLLFAVATFVGLLSARDIPQNRPIGASPSLEYEIINPSQPQLKPLNENTQSTNKTFVYDPANRSWTPVKSTDPEAKEGTLLWNQSNDKWLTQSFSP